jgi:hypothetical protein
LQKSGFHPESWIKSARNIAIFESEKFPVHENTYLRYVPGEPLIILLASIGFTWRA